MPASMGHHQFLQHLLAVLATDTLELKYFFTYFPFKPMTNNDGPGRGLYGPEGHGWQDL